MSSSSSEPPDGGSAWEMAHRSLAADAVLAEALLYVSGARRVTVEHGEPLTPAAMALLGQLEADVAAAVLAAGHDGGVGVLRRSTSITWTVHPRQVPVREVVLAARVAADRLNPGSWVITADDHR